MWQEKSMDGARLRFPLSVFIQAQEKASALFDCGLPARTMGRGGKQKGKSEAPKRPKRKVGGDSDSSDAETPQGPSKKARRLEKKREKQRRAEAPPMLKRLPAREFKAHELKAFVRVVAEPKHRMEPTELAQLRDAMGLRVPLQRTRVCRFWLQGVCRRGDACGFAHVSRGGGEEPASSVGEAHPETRPKRDTLTGQVPIAKVQNAKVQNAVPAKVQDEIQNEVPIECPPPVTSLAQLPRCIGRAMLLLGFQSATAVQVPHPHRKLSLSREPPPPPS